MFKIYSLVRLITAFLLVYALPSYAQQDKNKAKISKPSDSLNMMLSREKLYLHLDKSIYVPLDTLWFKAYLIEPSSNSYSTLSGLIYVDMVSANGTIVQSISLPTKSGISWGSLVLNPKIYESGTYTLRSYTNWMQNFGDACFFKKQVKIVNVPEFSSAKITPTPTLSSKKSTNLSLKTTLDPSIQFLPEGGNWIAGRQQKIAFKAIAPNGKGIAIEGEVKDSRLKQAATFKSNAKGMGYFTIIAEPEEIYTAYIKTGRNNYNQALPKTRPAGTSLIVQNDYAKDSLVITVISDLTDQALTMIGQAKGLIRFSANFPANIKRKTIKIAKTLFPTGVGQVLLQAGNQTLNERNFFINHQDQLKLDLSSTSITFANRDSIPVQIKVSDADKRPVGGSFSVAITDNNQVNKNEGSDDNILSYFLLTSDLKGEIEEPGYYFDHFNAQKSDELDALCLTQGWVNYNWDINKKPKYRLEKEYTISGKITNISNKPVAKAKVSIFGRNKVMMYGDTTTNENGEFVFRNLPPMDSAVFVLKVVNSKGKLGTLGFEVNEFRQLPIKATILPVVANDEPLDSVELNFIATKQQEYKANPANGIALREVNIIGKKTIKGSKNLNGPGEADQIMTAEELAKAGKKTLMQLLKEKVMGFHEGFRSRSYIKDYFLNSSRLKLIIDGIDVDLFFDSNSTSSKLIQDEHFLHIKFYLDYYTAEDIEGIEVMRSINNTSAYNFEFDNINSIGGVAFLEITTKSGAGPFLKKAYNTYLVKPMNYGDSKVFYSPKYSVSNKTSKKPDLRSTIYWAPNIVTNNKGEANISFFSADKKGSYTVWVEGSDMRGKFGMKTMTLKIN